MAYIQLRHGPWMERSSIWAGLRILAFGSDGHFGGAN